MTHRTVGLGSSHLTLPCLSLSPSLPPFVWAPIPPVLPGLEKLRESFGQPRIAMPSYISPPSIPGSQQSMLEEALRLFPGSSAPV